MLGSVSTASLPGMDFLSSLGSSWGLSAGSRPSPHLTSVDHSELGTGNRDVLSLVMACTELSMSPGGEGISCYGLWSNRVLFQV